MPGIAARARPALGSRRTLRPCPVPLCPESAAEGERQRRRLRLRAGAGGHRADGHLPGIAGECGTWTHRCLGAARCTPHLVHDSLYRRAIKRGRHDDRAIRPRFSGAERADPRPAHAALLTSHAFPNERFRNSSGAKPSRSRLTEGAACASVRSAHDERIQMKRSNVATRCVHARDGDRRDVRRARHRGTEPRAAAGRPRATAAAGRRADAEHAGDARHRAYGHRLRRGDQGGRRGCGWRDGHGDEHARTA